MAHVAPDLIPHDAPNRITDWPHFVPVSVTAAVFWAPAEVSYFLTSGGIHGFF
jgi:hypothetical protein